MAPCVCVVEDDREMRELVALSAEQHGWTVHSFANADEAVAALLSAPVDVVLTDVRMPGTDGIELCGRISAARPDVPIVVMTAFGCMATAVAALRAGAHDLVTKPIDLELLMARLERAAEHRELKEQVRVLRNATRAADSFGELIGSSSAMKAVYRQLEAISDSDASVLLSGESGTGKELVARALHRNSRRRTGPFAAVNCGALPESLLESELFGHEKGAFTDARQSRDGLLRQADGGTLLLDEIGECPAAMQVKLLRAIEERCFRPVGGNRDVPFDARIVSATNRDLQWEIDRGRFREDLFFRINVIPIRLPPLRARGKDVLLLAQRFLETFARNSGKQVLGLSDGVARRLLDYNWPGNVRELRNAIEHAVTLTSLDRISVEDLPERIRTHRGGSVLVAGDDPVELVPLPEFERRYILHVLEVVGGNRTEAARVLGLDRKTLYRRLKMYESVQRGPGA